MVNPMLSVLFATMWKTLPTYFLIALWPNLLGAVNCCGLLRTLPALQISGIFQRFEGGFQTFSMDAICCPELGAMDQAEQILYWSQIPQTLH
jgi:hypothetical protein